MACLPSFKIKSISHAFGTLLDITFQTVLRPLNFSASLPKRVLRTFVDYFAPVHIFVKNLPDESVPLVSKGGESISAVFFATRVLT